jgi:flagellar biosynthesis protein FlhG
MACTIAITSGKGGVGKTNAATNVGVALRRLGREVCIFDADLGLSNVNILTGLSPAATVEQLLDESCTLEEIVMEGPAGVHIVPSGSGIENLTELSAQRMELLAAALDQLSETHDYLLIDTAAGIGSEVLWFVKSAQAAVIVVSPEPTSLTDAYALIKVLHRQGFDREFLILVNMAASEDEAKRLFGSINNASKKFLGREMSYLGYVLRDYALASSVIKQTPVTVLYPDSAASICFADIAQALDSGVGARYGAHGDGASRAAPGAGVGYGEALARTVSEDPKASPRAAAQRGAEVIPLNKSGAVRSGGAPVFPARGRGTGTAGLDELCRRIEAGELDEDGAREALARLENSFLRRFGRPYFDLRSGIYSLLDFADVSSGAIKETAMLLESIHERRFGEPLFGLEDMMLKALAGCDSEAEMQKVMRTLETSFVRRFGRSSTELERLLEREADAGTLTVERMQGLADLLDALHRERFGAPLHTPGAIYGTDIEALLDGFRSNEECFHALGKALVDYRSDREALKRHFEELMAGTSLATLKENNSEG